MRERVRNNAVLSIFCVFFCCSFYDKNVARIYASKHYVFL